MFNTIFSELILFAYFSIDSRITAVLNFYCLIEVLVESLNTYM